MAAKKRTSASGGQKKKQMTLGNFFNAGNHSKDKGSNSSKDDDDGDDRQTKRPIRRDSNDQISETKRSKKLDAHKRNILHDDYSDDDMNEFIDEGESGKKDEKKEDNQKENSSEAETFEVEKIVDKRRRRVNGKLVKKDGRPEYEYYVKWLGYDGEDDNTWEPLSVLEENAMECVHQFENEQKKEEEQKQHKSKNKASNSKGQKQKDASEQLDSDAEMIDAQHHDASTPKNSRRSRRSRNRRSIKSYFEEDSGDDHSESDEEVKKPAKARSKKTKSKSSKISNKRKRTTGIEDSDFEDNGTESSDIDDMNIDKFASEGDDDEDEPAKPKRKPTTATKRGAKKKARVTVTDNKEKKEGKGGTQHELEKLLDKERNGDSYRPKDTPQNMPEKEYVEPVGIDATDGIAERIIREMIKKLGSLLLKATKVTNDEREKGELPFPLKLQTACSGTDAPSIALEMILEELGRLTDERGDNLDHSFAFKHVMSCEIDPFKQAYIGRNFPDVTLYPDICKLTDGDQVTDVYGREHAIPDGNLFVAGTSCKDFSMLKSDKRKDIEDKGTSGETFLAAVEFLEKFQPPVAIFENVEKAPWDKMQQYITGRLELATRNVTKGISDAKKSDADSQLKFSTDSDGNYVVEQVPRHVGATAGAIVEGFIRNGSKKVKLLNVDDAKTSGVLTLAQLAKKHKINLREDTLVMKKKARYCTQLIKLDTKDYGLPQTRNRGYLFIWRSDDPYDDLGDYFLEIMTFLKTKLLYPMDSFLVSPTHERIRCFREALTSGPGLLVAKERAKELDFWDYGLSGVKDLALHICFREVNDIEQLNRWLTQWSVRGNFKIAPGLWPELVSMWNMRRKDLIDCFAIAALRDTISRDALHHSFTWDLSQNVNRATVRGSVVGVSGCITPGGEIFMPYLNRTMLGLEKLSLQGIPTNRLQLGAESEVQLSDLAGNAMSLTVVGATMLAAICAPQLRRERTLNGCSTVELSRFSIREKYDSEDGAVLSLRGDFFDVPRETCPTTFGDVFIDIAKGFAREAFECSVLCTCETSGRTTDDDKILQCKNCGFTTCHKCSDRYQIDSHELIDLGSRVSRENRPDSHEFERKLRCAAPSILRLGDGWETEINECQSLESYSFQLQRVERSRGCWNMIYGAWEDHGSGRQVAELRVSIGKIQVLDTTTTTARLVAYVKCFGPALRHENPKRGTLLDSARIVIDGSTSSKESLEWETRGRMTKCRLNIVGSDPCDSQRVLAGITDGAKKSIESYKFTKRVKLPEGNFRNSLKYYHKRWKEWPGTIEISGDSRGIVNGIYRKQTCKHTTVFSALWRRDKADDQPELYIYIRPNVIRQGLDVAVISTSPSYRDRNMEICELVDWIPENALVEKQHATMARFFNWDKAPNLSVEVPASKLRIENSVKSFPDEINASNSQVPNPALCEICGLSKEVMSSILQHTDVVDAKKGGCREVVTLDLNKKAASQNSKILSRIAGPSLIKYAAEGKLPLELSVRDTQQWFKLSSPTSGSLTLGFCEKSCPHRPQEIWEKVKDSFVRKYDPEASNDFYVKHYNRPTAFVVDADRDMGKLIIRMNPHVAAHQAAAHLIRGRGFDDDYVKNMDVEYCLSELSSMGEPLTKEFHVPNSDAFDEAVVEGLNKPLYKRQAKALTRMQAIEAGNVTFSEEERSEHVLPGIGWCLIARARKASPLKGGVLGDAIGSGKTVVTIALILSGVGNARKNRNAAEGKSGATLIVVPPALLKQWDDERKKFTSNKLRCITIHSTAALAKCSVNEICNADIVIVPAGILEEKKGKVRPYTERLSKMAGAEAIPPAPQSYSQREAPSIEGTWVRNMASGPSIYVGNDGKQHVRDEQAYYGYSYSQAITKLREKKFKESDRGVPLEYFSWERVVIDECHETLVTATKEEVKATDFKQRDRRGAREFLGVSNTKVTSRPLVARKAVWGLTGTPLLETEARVTELANLMGGTYLTGSAHHWRKEERESGRDLFLNQQEASKSREYRRAVQDSCHSYVREACQRNRGEKLPVEVKRQEEVVNMTVSEGEKFKNAIKNTDFDSFTVTPTNLGEKAGEALAVTASSVARHKALAKVIDSIQSQEPETKIIIFANAYFGGYKSALSGLRSSNRKFCSISSNDSVERQNEVISWFRHIDAIEEDRQKPRVLLLSFEQAAGHNLQEACHHVIMYDPMYSGEDAVADASVEEQAVGRVYRQGQKKDVVVTRILVKGPNGESCMDDYIAERNTNEHILAQATSNFD